MSEGHTDATHCKKCGGWFKAGAGRVFLGGECFHLECAPVPDEKIDMPFMPIVGDEHAFQALRDLARSQADALTAKDAEIERLREALKGLVPILEAVRYTAGLGKNQMARVEKAKALIATETHERGDVGRQDRRSGVSAHGEPPDTPTGDTR